MTPFDTYPAHTDRPHGSPARVSGELTRAMSTLYLSARPEWSRERLIRHLKDKLTENGVHFHERSLRRQLGGAVESVPPELEAVLRQVITEDTPYKTDEAIDSALQSRGLTTTRPDPDYVSASRAVSLTRLWLYLHQGTSKRALAQRLSADLASRNVTVGLDALQSELAGRGQLVRREVIELLVSYLAGDEISSEADAYAKADEWKTEIEAFEQGRDLVDGERFRGLARLWQMRHKQASSRKLASLLGEKLRERGVKVGLDHLQRLVSGKARRIRVEVMQAMDEMMRGEVGEGELETLLESEPSAESAQDLAWVQAQPIRELAQEWVRIHTGSTMRQLALRVAQTVRRMGYSTSHNTIQPILGGWKQRTRGYVYRAMLMQFEDGRGTEVPKHHVITSMRTGAGGEMEMGDDAVSESDDEPAPAAFAPAAPASSRSNPALDARAPEPRRSSKSDDVTLEGFMRDARKSLPKARSPLMARLLALRANRLFGVEVDEATDMITAEKGNKRNRGHSTMANDEVEVVPTDDLATDEAVGSDVAAPWERAPRSRRDEDEGGLFAAAKMWRE